VTNWVSYRLLLLVKELVWSHCYNNNIESLTSQLLLGNIHLSCDAAINSIRLGGIICGLKSFLQFNMCQELQICAAVYMYWGGAG